MECQPSPPWSTKENLVVAAILTESQRASPGDKPEIGWVLGYWYYLESEKSISAQPAHISVESVGADPASSKSFSTDPNVSVR